MVLGAERHIFMLEIQISNVQDEVVVADKWLHSVGAWRRKVGKWTWNYRAVLWKECSFD